MSRTRLSPLLAVIGMGLRLAGGAVGQEAEVRVRVDQEGPRVSRFMTGVCLEDVNHEIYGGIDSQMVFGESFAEPPSRLVEGFTAYGEGWRLEDTTLVGPAADGPKLVADRPPLGAGEVAVRVRFADDRPGLAGLILKVGDAAVGADRFRGYEVSLDPSRQVLGLGRHRQNWEPIRDVPCAVPVGRWVDLAVTMTDAGLAVRVDGKVILECEDTEHPLEPGGVGLRTWRREAEFQDLRVDGMPLAFRPADPGGAGGVSGMWSVVRRGTAAGPIRLVTEQPFSGSQSQRIAFEAGAGAVGVANRGLNRRGMSFEAGQPYEGYVWARADAPATLQVSAESGDGARTYAEAVVRVEGEDWSRYDFKIIPNATDPDGRLALTLREPGAVTLGYAFFQPGDWGRFRGLPVRRDVAEGLIRGGVTVIRMGGLMVNAEGYRWKAMLGPRALRAPYAGYWYPYSSRGWGVVEFLDFCEAAEILPVVDLNLDETPRDVADLVQYANGPADSGWGRRRAEAGHPEPYGLKYLELGNEEAVDARYWERFRPIAEAVWAEDPAIVLIVGDFEYKQPINDPDRVEGAPRIESLAAHRQILDLARANGREVWFDVHIWNQNPGDAPGRIAALATFDEALRRLSPGAEFRLCVLEENATNHAVRRALAHGETLNGLLRLGDRVRIVCAANALQPDGQNDNGWDQGLLFLNPSRVWAQPPLDVTRMVSRNLRPTVVAVATRPADALDATATADATGVTLQVANVGEAAVRARVVVEGAGRLDPAVEVTELQGPLDATNTAEAPDRVAPASRSARLEGETLEFRFAPRSFTVLRFSTAN